MSAALAHELNNIAVPLRGFIDLATEGDVTAESVGLCLEEARIGVERMAALAFELESLAQDSIARSVVALSECFVPSDSHGRDGSHSAAPSGDQDILVNVDLGHARRAIASLRHLGGGRPLAVGDALPPGALCVVCGAGPLRAKDFVQVQVGALRPGILAAFAAPFGAEHKIRAPQRLAVAALRHIAHCAGGHVVVDACSESVSVTLPKA